MHSPGTFPEVVEIVVEIPRGSRNKYEFDEEVGVFRLDRLTPGRYQLSARDATGRGESIGSIAVGLGASTHGVEVELVGADLVALRPAQIHDYLAERGLVPHRGDAAAYDLDLGGISQLWMQGSVVRSLLLELAAHAFQVNGSDLQHIKGWVADSGEGRWTVQESIDRDVPAPVITLSLQMRFRSRQPDSYGAKVLAALRNEFGGHEVKTE